MSRPVVIALAGGVSSRFWPLRDKHFLEFGSQTLIERHVGMLAALGCERFVVVVRPEAADKAAGLLRLPGVEVRLAEQPEAKGMADAVLRARPALAALGDGPVYVTQAHDIVDLEMHRRLLDAWESRTGALAGVIAAARVQTYFPGGYFRLNGERLTGVVEKPGAGNEPSDLVNIVAHLYGSASALFDALAAEAATAPGTDDAYERALTRLMAHGEFQAAVYEGRWQALKYPWHVLDVMGQLLEAWTSGRESPGEGYEQREDGVFIGREVRLLPGAHIAAPALIGHGSVIGNNALVRGSLVAPRCVVGFGSEVARSYLGEAVELHHNYVGDSVLDRGSSMGYGAVTANYRLDGRSVPMFAGALDAAARQRIDTGREKLGLVLGAGSKIGVQTSTMPGLRIGAGAIVGPSLRVTRDLPDGARLLSDDGEHGRL